MVDITRWIRNWMVNSRNEQFFFGKYLPDNYRKSSSVIGEHTESILLCRMTVNK